MAAKFPDEIDVFPPSTKTARPDAAGPSQRLTTEHDLEESWTRFKSHLESNMQDLVQVVTKKCHILELRRLELAFGELTCEFDYADPSNDFLPDMKVTEAFWSALLFRPDMAAKIAEFLRGEHLRLEPAAAILQGAIDSATWLQDLWSLDLPQINVREWRRVIRSLSHVLTGTATYALPHLRSQGLLSPEGQSQIKKHALFSTARGQALAECFAERSSDEVIAFFRESKNAFVLTAIRAAFEGAWRLVGMKSWGVPDLPPHFIERAEVFAEVLRKMEASIENLGQRWVGLIGPGGSGKTTLAIQMAHEANRTCDVAWLSFRNRDAKAIFDDAQRLLADVMKKTPSHCAETFLKEHITMENTCNMTIFIDDVWHREHLEPFKKAKSLVISSRNNMESIFKHLVSVRVPLSLTKTESEEIFQKVTGKEVSSFQSAKDIHRMLKKISFNALASTALSSILIDIENDDDIADIEKNLNAEFDSLDPDLDESVVFFPTQSERNIGKILKMTIDRLDEDRRLDFDRLIVSPIRRSMKLSTFAIFYSSERIARSRLDYLERRCILEKRGEYFILHDLWFDVLRQRVTAEQEKKLLGDFCDGCLNSLRQKIDWDDIFLLMSIFQMFIEADRIHHVPRLLSSARFLFARGWHLGIGWFYEVIRELLSILAQGVEAAELNSALAFALESQYIRWAMRIGRCDCLRLMVSLSHGHLDEELLDMARMEAILPLFRIDPLKVEEGEVKVAHPRKELWGYRKKTAIEVELPFGYGNCLLNSGEEEEPSVSFAPLLDRNFTLRRTRAELTSSFDVAWIPSLDDFALFFLDCEEKVLRIERPNGEVLLRRQLPHWELKRLEMSVCGNRAAVWESFGCRFLLMSFEDGAAEEGVVERALEPGERPPISKVLHMATSAVVVLRCNSVEIWSQNARQKIPVQVRSVAVSPCGMKLALLFWTFVIIEFEVEEEPVLIRRYDILGAGNLKYLSDGGLLIYMLRNFNDRITVLFRDGRVNRILKNCPMGHDTKVAPTDGSFIFMIDSSQCWVYDMAKEVCEAVVDAELATRHKWTLFRNIACDPPGRRVILQCEDSNCQPVPMTSLGSFSLHRLDSDAS